MRLGFWPPVYGNWIISNQPELCDASFDTAKRATLEAERLGFDTLLLAEHFMNPAGPELDQLDAWTTASALAVVQASSWSSSGPAGFIKCSASSKVSNPRRSASRVARLAVSKEASHNSG